MVPFSLRILQAELPQYMGRPKDALDNLYELQRTCCKVLKNLQDNLTEDGVQGEMTPEGRLGKKIACCRFSIISNTKDRASPLLQTP